jgi:sterol desaturase/sphingolipid hydroxylase (fatty acid hydroxylase superfamily)
MNVAGLIPILLAVFTVFFFADLVYALDHYLVHRDRARYRRMHGRHHKRYNGRKDAPQLDAYELTTYSSAAFMLTLGMSLFTLFTGNVGFLLGALLKWIHSFTFHCYQHGWWSTERTVRQLELGRPKRTWGLATAKYHAWHHSNPDDSPFTYAESWAGFDRILERVDPWLEMRTVNAREKAARAASAQEQTS